MSEIIASTCIWIEIPPKEMKNIINNAWRKVLEKTEVEKTPFVKSNRPLIKTKEKELKAKKLIKKNEIK